MIELMYKRYIMLKPVKNKEQYEAYLERAYELMQSELLEDSNESDELEVLSILIEEYEKKFYPVGTPNPLEAIQFRLDHMNLKKTDLSEILGYQSRVSDIFSGRRKLNLNMIRKLHKKLNIPAEVLIREDSQND